jgi:hypothetical protein
MSPDLARLAAELGRAAIGYGNAPRKSPLMIRSVIPKSEANHLESIHALNPLIVPPHGVEARHSHCAKYGQH